jgi:hypothetical protein
MNVFQRRLLNTVKNYQKKARYVSVEEAVGFIKSQDRVFLHDGSMVPQTLLNGTLHACKSLIV